MTSRVRFAWISEAWRLFLACKRVWLAAAAFAVGLAILLCIGLALVISSLDHAPSTPSRGFWPDFFSVSLGFDALSGVCYLGVLSLLTGAAHRMAVRQVRGEAIRFRDLFHSRVVFLPSIGYFLLGGALLTAGWLACLLPGWIFTALLLPVSAQIADGDPPGTAITASLRAVSPKWGRAMILTLILCLLTALGLAPYLLGFLIIQPLFWLISALAYRDMIDLPRKTPLALPDYGLPQAGVWPPPPLFESPTP